MTGGTVALRAKAKRRWPIAAGLGMAGAVAWAVLAARTGVARAGLDVERAAWTLVPITGLHLVQLWLSAEAWRGLLARPVGRWAMFRLRLIREAVNSLLPVAHVGGDIVGVRLLVKSGLALAEAVASVVVDLTLEVAALALFLLAGLAALAACAGTGSVLAWIGSACLVAGLAGGMLAAQRFGFLHLFEALTSRIGRRWPSLASGALDGLSEAAHAIYRRRTARRAVALHALAWLLGTVETWLILRALGVPAGGLVALAIESLGTAARVAGFAVPGALGIQEGGFVLAALAVGLPGSAGLAVSLVKRIREIVVGIAGLALWAA